MKSIISKIKNKRLKGNVSLLIIFILLASSVIALLSINQIQRLLTYWNMTFNYFRSFYLAKAWTELGLSEIYNREAWFEQIINSWDAIITENLIWIYTGFNPYFTMNISWDFQYLTNDVRYTTKNDCSGDNKITLWTWEWIVLSLFNDELSNSNNIKKILSDHIWVTPLDWNKIMNLELKKVEWNWSPVNYFTFWLFDYDNAWNMNNIFVEKWDANKLSTFLSHASSLAWSRKYLTIKNPWTWNEIVKFCINMNDQLIPYSDSLITVKANYGDMEVWLQSVIKKSTPSWALNVLWWM